MVDAAFGEVMVTCEKISWLIREGERWLKPEKRSSGVMVPAVSACIMMKLTPVKIYLSAL